MTTTRDQRARAINALAAVMVAVRPEWDQPGCVAALRAVPDAVSLPQLGIAAMRYAEDPSNLTPEWLSSLENRAWDSDFYRPCTEHPECRSRRTNGECSACWSNRVEPAGPLPLRRVGRPMPQQARDLALAAIAASLRRPETEPAAEGAVA